MQTIRFGHSRLMVCFAALTIAFLRPLTANAQHTSRDLNGTVTDPGHEPLSGAVVQVEDESLKTVRSYTTDRTGHYSFLRLDGGTDFKIWAGLRGHQSPAKTLSLFDTSTSKTLDLIIELH